MRLSVLNKKVLTIIITLLGLTLPLKLVEASDYLSELEAEANSISDNLTSQRTTQPAANLNISDLQKSQLTEFERTLQDELPSTYKLYIRLPVEQRLIVVENYFLNNKQMSAATKHMFSLYFEK